MKGYTGKILEVDLTNKVCKEIKIKDEVYENILSGAGLGAWWCYRNIPAGADPMGPDNVLCLTTGLLTCTGAVIMGRWMAITKSPATGGIGEANCGGTFAPGIKKCGYDMIAFKGKSETPVYLYCDNNGPQLLDATPYWGMDTCEAERALLAAHTKPGKKRPVACVIGPSGEKGSWMAGICNDNGRIAARQGVGGVMGSKNLKGCVMAGTHEVSGEYPEKIRDLSTMAAKRINIAFLPPEIPAGLLNVVKILPELTLSPDGLLTAVLMGTWGTAGAAQFAAQTGEAPIRNWGGTQKEHFNALKINKVDASQMLRLQTNRYYCYSCVYGCGGEIDISNINYNDKGYSIVHKPEYESQWDFTGFLLSDDNDAMLYLNEYLNRMGMDTISCGGVVGMIIECLEHGVIKAADYGIDNVKWGDAKGIIKLTEMVANREGKIGEVFTDGTRKAANIIGGDAWMYAVQGGGTEPPMHDSRLDPQQCTLYGIDPTPARHTSGGSLYYGCMHLWKKVTWAPEAALVGSKEGELYANREEALKVMACACYKRLIDGVGGCYFGMILGVAPYPIFEWINAATGWDKTPDELMEIGRRVFTLRQMFNLKHGKEPWDNRPHGRMIGEAPFTHKVGKTANKVVQIDDMMMEAWDVLGYDRTNGHPTEETIAELGLDKLLNAPEEEYIYG